MAFNATPEISKTVGGTVPVTCIGGRVEEKGSLQSVYSRHMTALKHLHVPKMCIPTGLTGDGKPTAVQIWGRAVPYEHMFDDEYAARHDALFLHMVARVAAVIQAHPELRRQVAPMVARAGLG